MTPRVSIVMSTYNVAPFIREAVESALNQTFTDFELIVADDGSTDGTPEIVAATADPRLHLLRLQHVSAPAALNAGVARARGEYLALLDGDDRWHPAKLEKHLAFLDAHPEVDLSFSWSRIIDECGADTGHRAKLWTGPISFTHLLVDNVIANGSAVVMRLSAFHAAGRYDENLLGCYDLDTWLRLARLRPGNLHAVPEILTDYRRRAGQQTKDTQLMEKSWLALLGKMRTLEPAVTARAAGPCCVNLYRFLSYVNSEQRNIPEMLRCLGLSWRHGPLTFATDYRSWGLLAIAGLTLLLPQRWEQAVKRHGIRWVAQRRRSATSL